MPSTSSDLPRAFGPYELVRLLASGSVVDIFLAQARAASGFQKAVAIKMIRAAHVDDDPDFVRQLVEEANIASHLQHKNIVQVLDLGEIDRQPYIAMEYVDGIDLATFLRRLGDARAVPARVAAYVVHELCEGLDHAHRKTDAEGKPLRIVHRAVSPSNILLSNTGDVKLNDFGLAKASLRAASTQAGQIKGKYAYMAPEQARGHAVDLRADVFAAGIVLYELVTGRPAYPDAPLPILLERLTRGVFEPAEKFVDLHPMLANVLRRATAPELSQRHPSARALADDLDVFLRMLGGAPEVELAQLIERVSDTARSQLAPLVDDMSHEVISLEVAKDHGRIVAAPPVAAHKVLVEPAGIGAPSPSVDVVSKNVARVRHAPGRGDAVAPAVPARVSTPPPLPAVSRTSTPQSLVVAREAVPSSENAPLQVLRAPSIPGPSRLPMPVADDHPTEVMDTEGPDAALLATAAAVAPLLRSGAAPAPLNLPVPASDPVEPATTPSLPSLRRLRDEMAGHASRAWRLVLGAGQRPFLVAVGVGVVLGVAGALVLAIALTR